MTTSNPTIKSNSANTYHRDGSVSYWDVYKQQWQRVNADCIDDNTLSTMTNSERRRIERHAQR